MQARHRRGIARQLALLLLLAGTTPAAAEEGWTWPEKAENLKELPADFPGNRLRAVMTGFTRALGVRCSHCHVGEEGQPLETYDFASDANPTKDTARAMLRLLGTVNNELKNIEPSGPQRVNMWCHTCHRGRPRPMRLAEELNETYGAEGIDATVALYRQLRRETHGRGTYDFSEASLNQFGYALLAAGKAEDAVTIFRLNLEFAPESGNALDSLAEAYKEAGETERAIAYYQKALLIDPDNDNAVSMLRELRNHPKPNGKPSDG